MTANDELERARAFLRSHQEASCTHMEPWKWGTAVFHEGLPLVYDLNFLRFESDDEPPAEELASEADSVLGGARLGHRQIVVYDETAGARLAPGFKQLGWKVDEHIVMAHHRAPDKRSKTDIVAEVDHPTVWPSREEFLRTYEWCRDDEIVSQMHAAYLIWMRAGNGRDFAIFEDGVPASFAMLWMQGSTAQIEDVGTLERYRNRGLSRAVVLRVLAEADRAGSDLTFLVADEHDWPKDLYSKLGFDPVGRFYSYLKTPS